MGASESDVTARFRDDIERARTAQEPDVELPVSAEERIYRLEEQVEILSRYMEELLAERAEG
ncbi:hypothetical protein [Curtobacterium sp. UCD-KPL2560]|uniref:hypothetical protein n=1 Tax=Curtobacterium sp. UCD-KPL2560 TaxID=1885315 RepID=UPI000825AC4D|nr:hypothetical protein [Curtobacterium sp. UCD-KPL2560]